MTLSMILVASLLGLSGPHDASTTTAHADRSLAIESVTPPTVPDAPSVAVAAHAMRKALDASLRWHDLNDSTVSALGTVVESAVLAATDDELSRDKRRRAAADFTAWLASPWWRPPARSPSGATDSAELAASASLLRVAIERWLATRAVSAADHAACIAEEQAMLAVLLESIDGIARERRLDDSSSGRFQQRVLALAEVRLSRRGNPFFPEWSAPRPIGAAVLGDRLAEAVRGDALLRAITERVAIELQALERDPRTAKFRRLLVDSQIDAAANRLDEIAAKTLDAADPKAPPREEPPLRSARAAASESAPQTPEPTTRTFDAFVDELLAGAPPGTSR